MGYYRWVSNIYSYQLDLNDFFLNEAIESINADLMGGSSGVFADSLLSSDTVYRHHLLLSHMTMQSNSRIDY